MSLLVVAYDIADEKRRARLRRLLLTHGDAVQESVFECEATAEQAARIKRNVRAVINPAVDKVAYYALCGGCAERVENALGEKRTGPPRVVVV